MRHNPLISIIIPVANNADPVLFKKVIKSLFFQTYKNFEIIAVIGKEADHKLFRLLAKYPKIKIIEKTLGKEEAQNYGAKKAKGRYLLMHDVDTELLPTALERTVKYSIKNDDYPLWLPKRHEYSQNYWILCRNFDFALYDKSYHANDPIFFKRDLFLKLEGSDPRLAPLDEFSFFIKLRNNKIPVYSIKECLRITHTSTNFLTIARTKYLRGKAFGLINKLYPNRRHENFSAIYKLYLDNIPQLLSHFYLLPGLFIIKLFNTIPLYWGMFNYDTTKLNFYEAENIASRFEAKTTNSNYGYYKHFSEVTALKKFLPKKTTKILEVGAGTGRITQFLCGHGHSVTPVEPSAAMLMFYKQKRTLPIPIKASGENLPFQNKSFPLVVSIRVLWHILDEEKQKQFLSEICRVASDGVILDITNKKRYQNPILFIPSRMISFFFKSYFNLKQAYLFDIAGLKKIINKSGFEITQSIPLEVTTPFWLNLFSKKTTRRILPIIYKIDLKLSSLIPPGRFLLKLTRQKG